MAIVASTTCVVTIGGVDLSDHIVGFTLDAEVDTPETTNFGSAGNREYVAGLKGRTFTIELLQDYAASKVYATILANFGASTAITAKPTSSATSATNPQQTFNCIINKDQPVAAKVGDVTKLSLTWPVTGAVTPVTS